MVFGAPLKKTNFLFCIIISETEGKASLSATLSVVSTWNLRNKVIVCLADHQHKCKVPLPPEAYLNAYVEETILATKQTPSFTPQKSK